MGIRETLKRSPVIGIALALVLIGVACFVLFSSSRTEFKLADQAFFTVDDGQTTFTAPREDQAPFEHEGKTAVKVNMYSCDGKPFIGYLSKLSDQDKKAWDVANEKAKKIGENALPPMEYLVKKPGQSKWVSNFSDEGRRIINITCDSGFPEIVHPN